MTLPPPPSASPDAVPLLEIRALGVRLEGHPILQDVNLSVPRRTLHALVGPNGGGKTTLLRAVLGLLPHDGEIRIHFQGGGGVGYVPQLLDFDRSMPITVGDFFALLLQRRPAFFGARPTVREDAERALEETGAAHLWRRPLGVLSGGELQRVLLAQALLPTPELLLLDEPTGAIDEEGTRMFEDALARIRRDFDLGIVLVSHDLDRVARIADTVTGINRSVIFSGRPGEVLSRRGSG